MEPSLSSRLADPARPVFLLGDVPPVAGTPPGACQRICDKFMARSRALASDGFVVYDIQDEPGHADSNSNSNSNSNMPRPFPFRRVMDSSKYAALLARSSGKQCLVYKCVADANFDEWLATATTEHGHSAINLVGRATSGGDYQGPTIAEAMNVVHNNPRSQFGCVCIAERHTLEAAAARGKSYPTEHVNMIRKQEAGCQWFVSQAVYDPEPTIRLLQDYAALCREKGVVPRKVILTFAPVSRAKTMTFLKWLGVRVPPDTETAILDADKPIERCIALLCDMLRTILLECGGIGVPLGISCESVSIFKAEIDGVHELFRRLQGILLDARGSPWKVQWIEVVVPKEEQGDEERDVQQLSLRPSNSVTSLASACLAGSVVGGGLVALGVVLGARKRS